MKRSTCTPFVASSKQLKTGNDTFKTSPIVEFQTGGGRFICSTLNHDRNLILIYRGCGTQRGVPGRISMTSDHSIDIFTLEGYLVTRIIIEAITSLVFGNVRFTDHMIMICERSLEPIVLTDLETRFPFSPHITLFVEFDERGDIYVLLESDEIAVYSQNLEFKRVLTFDLPDDSTISSFHIRDDAMFVFSYRINDPVRTVRTFVRSTMELENYFEYRMTSVLKDICIDQFSNIIFSTDNGICILPKNGTSTHFIFEQSNHKRILITDDSQLILINHYGTVYVNRLWTKSNLHNSWKPLTNNLS